jgi:uncharacterized repeat protein (TIGR03803 family)
VREDKQELNPRCASPEKRKDIMNIKHFRSIVVSVCLGWLAPLWAFAQPVITTQPVNQFRTPGQTAVFSVTTTGAGLTYQWLFDGTAMDGATNSGVTNRVLSLANPQPAQWGYYSVIVSNASGSVTSQVAELKVFVAAPHGFSSIQAESNGFVNLSFKGETTAPFGPYYDLYPVETSTNLVAWAPLVALQRTNSALDVLSFSDTNAPLFNRRFYRTPTNVLATPDPQPTGPYAVGTFSMLLSDPSRTNAAGKTNYEFMVTFWYPAVAQVGVLPARYVEPQVALSGIYSFTSLGGGNFGSQVAAFFSHSLSNAPLAATRARYPVVLYDAAYTRHRRENTDKAEDLASWGYVVVGLDTSDTTVSVFPNGKVVYAQTVDLSTIAQWYADIEGRLRDVQFVLDELERLNVGDPRLGGRLDLDKIGMFGWSLGGATAAQLCLRDSRCKAGAAMDGSFLETNLLTQPLSVPYLFFRADDGPDPDPGSSLPDGRPDDRLEVYNDLLTNAYWVKLASTVHASFGDLGLIIDSASLEGGSGMPMSGQFLPPARVSQIVRAYLLSFFNKFLQGEDDHLLDGPSPAYPEVMQFMSTSRVSVPPEYPSAALVQGTDGNLYGTTGYGGVSGKGTVFQITLAGALTTLISFNGTNGNHPAAALVQGSDGNFYGTTANGGTNGNNGTVFQITPAGVLTTLASFNGTNGSYPAAGLAQGSDGNFYGTTSAGGANNLGTVFEFTPAGVLTSLVSFNNTDGAAPLAAVVQGSDGNFYGTTASGGANQDGTVFKMTPAGVLTSLVSFNFADGFAPTGLVQGSDGNFYGTAEYGGNLSLNGGYGFGTVFRMTPSGALTTLASFNGINGSFPCAGLVQGSDGNFYGTTAGGGAGGGGTVFKMTSAGTLTRLVSFNGPDGNGPQAPLVQGSDGNFYGTTTYGGASGLGTVFRVTPAGVLTTLVSFGAP